MSGSRQSRGVQSADRSPPRSSGLPIRSKRRTALRLVQLASEVLDHEGALVRTGRRWVERNLTIEEKP